jgi:hypothetical protein
MKQIATAALMLNLGAAGVYAQQRPVQQRPVKMTFSGSVVATTIDLQPGTVTDEEHFAGNGTLGSFTFRQLRADIITPQPSSTCSGPMQLYFPVARGGGVFRFEDGSLLKVSITGGAICVDLAANLGRLTVTYQITGGTRRFNGASGALTLRSTLTAVLFNASNTAAKLLTNTGEFEGTVVGAAIEREGEDERQ